MPEQTEIYLQNNLTLKNLIINNLIKHPLQITDTLIPTDLENKILHSKLFRCTKCHYNLPEYVKYKKEYYMDKMWKVCCYRYSCISCELKK